MTSREDAVRAIIARADSGARTGDVMWRVRSDDGLEVSYGPGDRPFFIASATKLYVTALLAQLRAAGRLDWDSPITAHVPEAAILCRRIPGSTVTVRSVMAHTSGLPDYFEGKRADGPATFERLLAEDFGWDVRDVISWASQMKQGKPGRGLYSDTGYQLLGRLIEVLTGATFADAVRARVAEPLGLHHTYCFGRSDLERYGTVAPMRLGDTVLRIPQAMASVQADGGIVSTVDDSARFLDAFFAGELFDASLLAEMTTDWHRIFFPLEYGTGVMRFRLPRAMSGMRRIPAFVGHSGVSGTVMFRCPEWGLAIVGTVNQVRHRSLPFNLMVRTAQRAHA